VFQEVILKVKLFNLLPPNHLAILNDTPSAMAPIEDLRAAQEDFLEAKDLNELKAVFKNWRRIGWKNVCGAPRTSALQHT
jgi:hypothetical protein